MRRLFGLLLALLLVLASGVVLPVVGAQEKKPVPAMKEWEQDVRKRIEKDEKLKKLALKYPLVLLHSRFLYPGGGYKESAFSFDHETSDEKKHRNSVQL